MAALAGTATVPAGAQTVGEQPFVSYGTGSTVSADVLGLGGTTLLNAQAAFAGHSVNSQGLGGTISNELGYVVQPAGGTDGDDAYGRGDGLEIGLATPNANALNQVLLAGLAEAGAPPPSGLVERQIGPISLGNLAFASLLKGQAQATFDPNTCVIGKPLAFGSGEAANLQLLGTSTGENQPLGNPLIGVGLPPQTADRGASRTRTVSYLIPNGDGTFGLVSETRQTIAPISLLSALLPAPFPGGGIQLELLGEWALRAIATGKPGGARIEYSPILGNLGPSTTVARLTIGGGTPLDIKFQDIFGDDGFVLNLAPLLSVAIGAPARALGGPVGSTPVVAADGTSASAAVDVVSLQLLGLENVLNALDLRVGHMEAAVQAPAGGIKCNIPVDKIGRPDPVQVGQDFTITIRIPSDTAVFEQLFGCDLIGIKAVDFHTVESGNARFVLTGASNGGVISDDGTTVRWENLGDYHIGDPPIELTVTGRIPGNSGAGVLKDEVTVDASLGNCRGTGAGQDIVGTAIGLLTNRAVTGKFTLIGPDVRGGLLAATGGDETWTLLGGGVLVLGAVGMVALRRRTRRSGATA